MRFAVDQRGSEFEGGAEVRGICCSVEEFDYLVIRLFCLVPPQLFQHLTVGGAVTPFSDYETSGTCPSVIVGRDHDNSGEDR